MIQETQQQATQIYGNLDPRGWTPYLAVSLSTIRVIFKCKSCKQVWSREYRKCYTKMTTHYWTKYARTTTPARYDLMRFSADGKAILRDSQSESHCPYCDSWSITSDQVKGSYSEAKKCDSRCTGAKGSNCECQCNGANHGSGYAIR